MKQRAASIANEHSTVHVRDLRFSYPVPEGRRNSGRNSGAPDTPLLAIDSLQTAPGELTVLIGDNGCGKTTLLKLLAGLLTPDLGSIERSAPPPVLVHQKPYLFAESVHANAAWPLKIRGLPHSEIHEKTESALERVGLTHLARRWAPSLSGGEKQRTALARALVLDPPVLLLDEPTSNIDAASVATVERVLRSLTDRGTTVIMSTHNLASAYRLADRILPMSRGQLRPVTVNVLRGRSLPPGGEHIGRFEVQDGPQIYCPAVEATCTTAVIRMDDIILSVDEIETSAQNRLVGRVRSVEFLKNETVRVDLEVPVPLSALVTHRSVDELDLRSDREVRVTFKASAVELY